jgi:hypothetical protein
VCSMLRVHGARCAALTLRPLSVTPSDLRLAAAHDAEDEAVGVAPTVVFEHPFPGALSPQDLRSAYALPTETASSFLQTIAVIDAYNDPAVEADLGVYDSTLGLSACTTTNGCFRKINQEGNAYPLPPNEGGWAGETALDVEMAHSMCENCRILLVEANSEEFTDLGAAVNAAVKAGATEINNSYESEGEEASLAATLSSSYYNHPGTVITASAGDCGYLGKECMGPTGVSFPASSPDVIAVGATSLAETGTGWTSSVWASSGGGCSSIFTASPWQSEVANWITTGCGTARLVADTAAVGDPATGVDVYNSMPPAPGAPRFGWGIDGGTSVSSPILAGEFALSGGAHGVKYPARTLYSYVGDGSAMYDVVSGSNGTCGGATACQASIGYDGPSGVGSPLGLEAFSTPGSPSSTSQPTISGMAQEGQVLTAVRGGWTNNPTTYSYQWAHCEGDGRDCQPISGATAQTYTLVAGDVGTTIRVEETAVNPLGEGAPSMSAQTVTVTANMAKIQSFTPTSGITGSLVIIQGTPFSGASEVKFGTEAASYTIRSATQIDATVPAGAYKGKISVTTPIGIAKSNSDYKPTLAVRHFRPTSGPPGTTVVITGIGFGKKSTVGFSATAAIGATYVSPTRLRVVVPAGASTGPITVTNVTAPTGTVSSPGSYVVTNQDLLVDRHSIG